MAKEILNKKVEYFRNGICEKVKSIITMLSEWLKTLKDNCRYRNQEGLGITEENFLKQSRRVSNWKAP